MALNLRKKEEKLIKGYNKLIRDRIPEIIENAGEKPRFITLSREAYFKEIQIKILEEAKELIEAKTTKEAVDEIVDIQELIDTLLKELGITKFEFWELQRRKNKKRGGFKKRLFLIGTETEPRP